MSAISHLDDQQGLEVQLGQGVQRQEVLGVLGDLRFTICKLERVMLGATLPHDGEVRRAKRQRGKLNFAARTGKGVREGYQES